MNLSRKISGGMRIRKITTTRMVLAVMVAIGADALQFLLLPFAWTFVDSAIDVVAMLIITWLVGFHWLLLPTFVIEFVPVIDALPTWTACTLAVVAMRKRELKTAPSVAPAIFAKPPVEI